MRDSVRYKALRDAKSAVEAGLPTLCGAGGGASFPETRQQEILAASERIQTLMSIEYKAMLKRQGRKNQTALALQRRTGLGYRRCVIALQDAEGDFDHALEILDHMYRR